MNQRSSIKIGMLPILALVISLCLFVLAVLALSTAHAANTISERQAQATSEAYEVESAAQLFVGELDGILAETAGEQTMPTEPEESTAAESEPEEGADETLSTPEDSTESAEEATSEEASGGEDGAADEDASTAEDAAASEAGDGAESATNAQTEDDVEVDDQNEEDALPTATTVSTEEAAQRVLAALPSLIQKLNLAYPDVQVEAEVVNGQVVASFEGAQGRHLDIAVRITDTLGYRISRWNLTTMQADEGTSDVLWSGM